MAGYLLASHMIFGLGLGAALGFLSTTIIGGRSKVPVDTTIIGMSPDQTSASDVISTLSGNVTSLSEGITGNATSLTGNV